MLGLFDANPLFHPSPEASGATRTVQAVREEEPEGLGDWEADMKAIFSGSNLFVPSGADEEPAAPPSSSKDAAPPIIPRAAGVDVPTAPHFAPSEVPHFMARALKVKEPVQTVGAGGLEVAAVGNSAGKKWEKGVTLEELRALQVS